MMVASTSALLTPPAPHTSVAEPAARSSRQAAVLLSLGLVMTLLAAGAAYRSSDGPSGSDRRPVTSARFEGAGAFSIQGPGDVAVVDVVYEPSQTSGWHTHRGLHAVAVLSGTLTMYDRQCRPERYVPGKPYVGGQELHLARNETAEPVVMVVTYVNATGPAAADDVRPGAPPGCDVR